MTYSIVARDPQTGQLGVAVQSCAWATGPTVAWAQPGVGAVATQAFAEIAYGPRLLARLADGVDATAALAELVAADAGAEMRQVAVVDANGRVGVHTGTNLVVEFGHRTGDGYSVQANMMLRDTVPDAMANAFEAASGDLGTRLLAALDAAEAEGGDFRGRQGGAVKVVEGTLPDTPGHGVVLDIRVDDHPYPLDELRRLLRLGQDYAVLGRATDALAAGDAAGALEHVRQLDASLQHVAQRPLVEALALLFLDRPDDARRAVARYEGDRSIVRLFAERMQAAGLVPVDRGTIDSLFGT
jgi:uncharacterized Ntn-hydrolase superfamily protein